MREIKKVDSHPVSSQHFISASIRICKPEPKEGLESIWLRRSSTANMPQVEMILFLILIIGMCVYGQDPASKVVSDRYAVYWNRTNPR